MKKYIALLLALAMCLTLCACGGNTSSDNVVSTENDPDTVEETSTLDEEPETTEYEIGDSFGTDNIECVVTGFRWVTPEEFDSVSIRTPSTFNGENYYRIDTDTLFPECEDTFGKLSGLKSEIDGKYYLIVTFALQNIGKEAVKPIYEETPTAWSIQTTFLPYGTFKVIYDDGYTFDCGEDSGFISTLEVLGEPVQTVGGCIVPKQVYENEDKPLKIMVILPNSEGENEEFIVSVR